MYTIKELKELNPGDVSDEVDEVRDPAVAVGKDFAATLVRTEAHNPVLDPALVRRGVLQRSAAVTLRHKS